MSDETKPRIENLYQQEPEALTLEEAEEAQGGVGLALPPAQQPAQQRPAQKQ
jgi:hypothetical protein